MAARRNGQQVSIAVQRVVNTHTHTRIMHIIGVGLDIAQHAEYQTHSSHLKRHRATEKNTTKKQIKHSERKCLSKLNNNSQRL